MPLDETLTSICQQLNIVPEIDKFADLYPGQTMTGSGKSDLQLHAILQHLKATGGAYPQTLVDWMIDKKLIETPPTVRQVVRQQTRQALGDLTRTAVQLAAKSKEIRERQQ